MAPTSMNYWKEVAKSKFEIYLMMPSLYVCMWHQVFLFLLTTCGSLIHSFSYKWEKVLRNISALNKSCTHEPKVVRDGDLSLVKWPLLLPFLSLRFNLILSVYILLYYKEIYNFTWKLRDHFFHWVPITISTSMKKNQKAAFTIS